MTKTYSGITACVIVGLWLAGACAAGDVSGKVSRSAPGRIRYQPDRANAIEVRPTQARFVRIVIRSSAEGAVSLDEIEVYGPDGARNLARADAGAVASASSTITGYAIHRPENLNDGRYGNDHSWVAATAGEEWVQVELPVAATITRVMLSRDRTGTFRDRRIGQAEVRASLDGLKWSTLREVVSDDAPRVIPSRSPGTPCCDTPSSASGTRGPRLRGMMRSRPGRPTGRRSRAGRPTGRPWRISTQSAEISG